MKQLPKIKVSGKEETKYGEEDATVIKALQGDQKLLLSNIINSSSEEVAFKVKRIVLF